MNAMLRHHQTAPRIIAAGSTDSRRILIHSRPLRPPRTLAGTEGRLFRNKYKTSTTGLLLRLWIEVDHLDRRRTSQLRVLNELNAINRRMKGRNVFLMIND